MFGKIEQLTKENQRFFYLSVSSPQLTAPVGSSTTTVGLSFRTEAVLLTCCIKRNNLRLTCDNLRLLETKFSQFLMSQYAELEKPANPYVATLCGTWHNIGTLLATLWYTGRKHTKELSPCQEQKDPKLNTAKTFLSHLHPKT